MPDQWGCLVLNCDPPEQTSSSSGHSSQVFLLKYKELTETNVGSKNVRLTEAKRIMFAWGLREGQMGCQEVQSQSCRVHTFWRWNGLVLGMTMRLRANPTEMGEILLPWHIETIFAPEQVLCGPSSTGICKKLFKNHYSPHWLEYLDMCPPHPTWVS